MKPRISIVTISFNQAQFLERTILSVLEQKKDVDLQYILMDPGSTDGSKDIIEKYRNQIDIIDYSEDLGAADGLRKGFEYVDGQICGYLNSDDILCPGALKFVVEKFTQKNRNFDVLCCAANLIDENDNFLRKVYSDKFNLTFSAYSASVVIQPSSFFTYDIYKKTNGFNIKNKTNWDGELFIDMALNGARFKRLFKILSGYRIHSESITGTMSTIDKMVRYRAEMYEKITKKPHSTCSTYKQKYYKYLRKILNIRDTYQRIVNGRSFGRAVK